jgi:cell division protein FtsW
LMVGVIASAARHEPEAVAALRAGRDDRMTRLLRLPLPEPYVPTRVEVLRDRLRTRPQSKPAKPAKPPKSAKPPKQQRKADRSSSAGRPASPVKAGATGRPDRRTGQRSGHHGAEQRYAGRPQRGGRPRALEGQRYG